jgi:hypothetical protein
MITTHGRNDMALITLSTPNRITMRTTTSLTTQLRMMRALALATEHNQLITGKMRI